MPNDGVDQDCSGSDELGLGGAGGGGAGPGEAGAPNIPGNAVDADEDGWPSTLDCDDEAADVFPNADEIAYDGIDQDCSGTDLADLDGDGVDGGENGDDCDDAHAGVHPGRLEVALDGIDQDCDGSDLVGTDAFVPIAPADAEPGGVPYLATGKNAEGEPVVLAAWADSRNAPRQDIYARFLSADGKPKGAEFAIDVGGLAKGNVRIAANGDSYLVTWEQQDGIWAQQVSKAGVLEGSLLGVGPEGSVIPRPAWGGANWAVAWTNSNGEVRSRGVSTDGVRSDIHLVATPGFTSAPALAGGDGGFLVAWADGVGIQARGLSATGEPTSEHVTITTEPDVSLPALATSGNGYFAAFKRGGGTVSVRGQFVSSELAVTETATSLRLSADSFGLADIHIASGGEKKFLTWNDDRHRQGVPAYGAIYGNAITADGTARWTGDIGLHVDLTAELGGAAVIGENVLIATRVGNEVGVVVRGL